MIVPNITFHYTPSVHRALQGSRWERTSEGQGGNHVLKDCVNQTQGKEQKPVRSHVHILGLIHHLHLCLRCDWCVRVGRQRVISIQFTISRAHHLWC